MPGMKRTPASFACFGEALWDVLPRGIFLGGAPLNVACHLTRHGVATRLITAVGRDFLGEEIIRRLQAWDLDPRDVTRDPARPTGVVRAELDERGVARYEIARHAAWDAITAPTSPRLGPAPGAIVFGTLALRNAPNRQTLEQLIAAWPKAVRVLDLNLRAPFDRPSVIRWALRRAQILKLNDAELAHLSGVMTLRPGELKRAARQLALRHGLDRICVTAGAHGAGLWWDGAWYWEAGRKVAVRDTVGAGDAFLASLLTAVLVRRAKPAEALATACRLGEFVAGCDGATPVYKIGPRGLPRPGR